MKKITSILLLSIMLLTIFSTSAFAVVPNEPLKSVTQYTSIRSSISPVPIKDFCSIVTTGPVHPIEFIAESNPQPSP